jgi:hypothetical protein
MKAGRNEPCPCGSGKKFKNCHAEKTAEKTSSSRLGWILVVVVAAGAITLLASLRGGEEVRPKGREMAPPGSVPVSQMPSTPAEPPPGDPPPGKVWSKEHGHWHDVGDASQIQMSTTKIPITAGDLGAGSDTADTPGAPQPPGPAPAGKVWSVEHGHWHDVPGAATDPVVPPELQPALQPPGIPATPAGMVWSEEHQHWHDANEEAKRKGTVKPDETAPAAPAPAPKP